MSSSTARVFSPRKEIDGKKPPEPLRKAVAECLSSWGSNVHGSSSGLVNLEASRTLRDYISSPATTDLAYYVLIEHAVSEKERSPAVVSRCIILLKRYLLRYVPKVETLKKIDIFCSNTIAECDPSQRRGNAVAKPSNAGSSDPLPMHNFASPSLLKSLHYVKSLVARHIPRLSFPQITPSNSSTAGNQSLQTLSSLLSRSFNSNLSPEAVHRHDISEIEDVPPLASSDLSNHLGNHNLNDQYIFRDLLKWRWGQAREQESETIVAQSENISRPQDSQVHGFLEVGAAALLLENPRVEELFQPSDLSITEERAPSNQHLRAITASKRTRPSPQQFWMNHPVSNFSPRARALFQYRHYSEQQPLRLDPAEISDVIAAVCSDSSSPTANLMSTPRLRSRSERPYTDIAVSVLVKLVIDMYLMDSGIAAPLTLMMLEDMLISHRVVSRVRVFDVILNLGIHAHLLEPSENPHAGESESSLGSQLSTERTLTFKLRDSGCEIEQNSSAVNDFESWLLIILFENLFILVQMEEKEEIIWASALSCLFYFVCDRGKIRRKRLDGLDIRVIKKFLEISRLHAWTQTIRSKLISMLANMFYSFADSPKFLVEQVDLIGGISFICLEYSHAISREERQDLFSLLLDYVLCQIDDSSLATGSPSYNFEDIQFLATMLLAAEAPEAFYIAIKHGVEGIGEILKRSIALALTRSQNFVHLNMLLEKIASKLDGIIGSFSRLDPEFSSLIRVTRSFKYIDSIDLGDPQSDVSLQAKLSWANLHALLHSERTTCRHNGYIWLVELLFSEINEGRGSVLLNMKNFQCQIGCCSSQESPLPTVPLCISVFCGLLSSKVHEVRWGFLFVLEKFLMRCKLLLDEESSDLDKSVTSLEKANAVIDLMSSALTIVFQKNETDRINILKMCDILFSQLCLKVLPGYIHSFADTIGITSKGDKIAHGQPLEAESTIGLEHNQWPSDTSSIAALLLRGSAAVPKQLIDRVPTALFYWPLIQLAGAAADDIALGLAVGSKGRGNLSGSASDIRAALLLLLIGKCSGDPAAFLEVGGDEFFRELLDDTDSRVAYYSAAFLLKSMMTKEPDKYQRMLQNLIIKAQQSNNEKLLENPYLQLCGILQLSNDLGSPN